MINSGFSQTATNVRGRARQGIPGVVSRLSHLVGEGSAKNSSPQGRQVSTFAVTDPGDSLDIVITLNGVSVTYNTGVGGDQDSIGAALAVNFNQAPFVRGLAEAAYDSGTNILTFTALLPGSRGAFTISSNGVGLPAAATTTAATEADEIPFGRAILLLGYAAEEAEELVGLPKAADLVAQVQTHTVVTGAATLRLVTVYELRGESERVILGSGSFTGSGTQATEATAIANAINGAVAANTVVATTATADVIVTSEVPGLEFDVVIEAASGNITKAATTGPNQVTSLRRGFAGVARYNSNDVQRDTSGQGPASYKANAGVTYVYKTSGIWVENAETAAPELRNTVYVETAAGDDVGKFYAAPSATRVALREDLTVTLQHSSTFLDVTSAGVRTVDPSLVLRAQREAIALSAMAPQPRNDSARNWTADEGGKATFDSDAIDRYSRRADSLLIAEAGQRFGPEVQRQIMQRAQQRRDAGGFGPGAGGFQQGDFEYLRGEVWEEQREPLNAFELFSRDTSVPLGAREHSAKRVIGQGEAQIFRGGTDSPRAHTSYIKEVFPVVYVICAVETQFFDTLTTDWAGVRQYQQDLRMARRAVDERVNRLAWEGDEESALFGAITYPHLAKQVFPLTMQFSADPKEIVRQLHVFVDSPLIRTGGTFQPDTLVVSPRIKRYLATQKHENNGGSDATMEQFFLAGQTKITSIETAVELQSVGGTGVDGMYAYRRNKDSMALVDVQSTTPLPIYQSSALDQITIVYAAFGGVIQGDVGNNIFALVQTAGLGPERNLP